MLNEVKIIETELKHPNVTRYYRTFFEGKRAYTTIAQPLSRPFVISSVQQLSHLVQFMLRPHTNVDEKLYIVMEMVEGASLQDHFTSLVEKRETMEEARIWKIFVQICVALRYIHKDKVITDFSLSSGNLFSLPLFI